MRVIASLKIRSALFGLAVGDALGVPVEFTPREALRDRPVTEMTGYGTHNQPPGTWSDDSSLTFCLTESLSKKGYDLNDQADCFLRWYRNGYMTPHGDIFDIGNATSAALQRIEEGIPPADAGGRKERDNGNGALMRILPAAFYFSHLPEDMIFDRIREITSVTHGHWISIISCFIYVLVVRNLYWRFSPEQAIIFAAAAVRSLDWEKKLSIPEKELERFNAVLDGSCVRFPESKISSGGYVLDTLTAALWCFFNTSSYRECVLKAVNLGGDTDTTAAVAGGLAGTYYGLDAVPQDWIDTLVKHRELETMFRRFADICSENTIPSVPFSNSYWVIPGRLLAGDYPRCVGEESSRIKISNLLQAVISCIIDLTMEGDWTNNGQLKPYDYLVREFEQDQPGRQKPCTLIRRGIEDVSIPNRGYMTDILDIVDEQIKTGHTVYIHCWGGHGRTGTVVGCWMKRHGIAADEKVFDSIRDLRKNMKDAYKNSPETEEQREFIRGWLENN